MGGIPLRGDQELSRIEMVLFPIALTMIVGKNCIVAFIQASNAPDRAFSNVVPIPLVFPKVAYVSA
jgi:hypothetical protein